MEFKNKPNELAELKDGRKVWLSRSTAVNALILEDLCYGSQLEYNSKFLLVRRSEKMNEGGKWCMPCGYIDYNESLEGAVFREVYEETGLDPKSLTPLETCSLLHQPKPSVITSQAISKLENIEHTYMFSIRVSSPNYAKLKFIDGVAKYLPEHILEEVSEIRFFTAYDILMSTIDIAFNHKEIILHCLAKLEIEKLKK